MADRPVRHGLDGVVAAETRLSHIDGEAGELTIGGFPLPEIAGNATFEETVYLLRHDRLPTADERASFRAALAGERPLPAATVELLRANADANATDALRMGVASLPASGDPATDATSLVARVPTIVATHWRLRNDEEPIAPDPNLGHTADYLRMMTGEHPSEAEIRGLETYLDSVVDHGLNASTFTARAIVSTESDLVSAVTGAVGALKGPLHGGAPGPVLEMLLEIRESGDPEGAIRERLDAGERMMGFGHRVYRTRDPRAKALSAAAERFYDADGDGAFFELAAAVERHGVEALAAAKPDLSLETNVEFYTAVLLHGLGVPTELFTPTFAVARVAGWTAHCLEQLDGNRIIRPRSRYVGATNRTWTPVENR